MLIYILAACAVILLIALYRLTGHSRKAFYGLCAVLALAGSIAYWAWPQGEQANEPLTLAQQNELARQQQVFALWYKDYQKDLTELDHNWQWYHHILESFKEGNISIQTVHIRLTQLEQDSAQLTARIQAHAAPLELDEYCYDLASTVITKTSAYAAAQHKAIALTRAAADPARMPAEDPAEQSRLLQDVMLRESPVALFTAEEITAIREQLALPKEKGEAAPQE